MSSCRVILRICGIFVQFMLLAFAWKVLKMAYWKFRYKMPFSIRNILAGYQTRYLKRWWSPILFIIVFVAGSLNLIFEVTLSSTQIGAFYEKVSYQETYEATLYLDDKPVFCLVDMRRKVYGEEDSRGRINAHFTYWLEDLYLPYGRTAEIYSEYEPGYPNSIELLGYGASADIVLDRPATESSEERLKAEVITAYGPYCASREKDKYHYRDCVNAKWIRTENMIFFESPYEASVFGFSPCARCVGD